MKQHAKWMTMEHLLVVATFPSVPQQIIFPVQLYIIQKLLQAALVHSKSSDGQMEWVPLAVQNMGNIISS